MHLPLPHPRPSLALHVGSHASFDWQCIGLGNTTCTIDGNTHNIRPLTRPMHLPAPPHLPTPPAPFPQVGSYASFDWQYTGLGNTTCTIDGKRVGTDPLTGQCTSPLRTLINDTLQHALVVTFTDVCGVTRRDYMNFSVTNGWATNATIGDASAVSTDFSSASPSGLSLGNSSRLSTPSAAVGLAATTARGLFLAVTAAMMAAALV